MSFIVGIDPGLGGAVAFFDPCAKSLGVVDMPTLNAGTGNKKIIDEDNLARLFDCHCEKITHVFIELVGAMPGQGVTSMFNFGKSYGIVLGILAANFLPRTLVTPQKWKKAMGVPASKDGARARASQLLPKYAGEWARVKDDGRAESALIALYGSTQMGDSYAKDRSSTPSCIFD